MEKGDITYRTILEVFPFSNEMCVIEVTGQQILDALEWGCSKLPDEFGGFPQLSGLTYEIDMSVPSSCTKNDEGMFDGASNVILTGKLDSEVLSDYIKDTLGGVIGAEYADPYGQGRYSDQWKSQIRRQLSI